MERPSDEFLKDAYLRGFDHGSDGYVRSPADAWEEAAYSIGWEDGASVSNAPTMHLDILDRIIERFRAMHESHR